MNSTFDLNPISSSSHVGMGSLLFQNHSGSVLLTVTLSSLLVQLIKMVINAAIAIAAQALKEIFIVFIVIVLMVINNFF